MPILGNLSEFPLPEVLLLIGARTGRLRLLDVPEFGVLDIDFFNGKAEAMHMGTTTFTDIAEMIDKLGAVVQAQGGMFEFRLQSVVPVDRSRPLMVNELVMSLVCHVDQQVARLKATASPNIWYVLEVSQPDIWIEPELNSFFIAARTYLVKGVHVDDLAEKMGLNVSVVHKNLTNLRLLGQIKMVEGAETVPLGGVNVKEEISRKSTEFQRASQATGRLKKLTSKVPTKKPEEPR